MLNLKKSLFLFLMAFAVSLILMAQENVPEEIKISEADKKAKDDKEKAENLAKDQEKKALENSRNFFKFISTKKSADLKKLISIPFIFDDSVIYTKKGVDEIFDEMEEGYLPENQTIQFSIDRQPKEYTENNIVIILKDNNAEVNESYCMWLDRDTQKIIGFFIKDVDNGHSTEFDKEKIKAKEEIARKKAQAIIKQQKAEEEALHKKRISEEEALKKSKDKDTEEKK